MPSKCACGCGAVVANPGHRVKACRERLLAQGLPCPPNVKRPYYHALRLAVQQHGPQQKAQWARTEAGLDPMTFKPLLPHMQHQLDIIKTSNSTHNPLHYPINSKKRKLESCAKNKQTV